MKAAGMGFVGKVCGAAGPHPVPSITFCCCCLKLLDLGYFYDPSHPQRFPLFPRAGLALIPKQNIPSTSLVPSHGLGGNSGEGSGFPDLSFPGEPEGVLLQLPLEQERQTGHWQLYASEISWSSGSLGSLGSETWVSVPLHSPFPPYELPRMQHPPGMLNLYCKFPGKSK